LLLAPKERRNKEEIMTVLGDSPTRAEVIAALKARWQPQLRTEKLALSAARGRVVAREYRALYDQPVVRASAFDGIAVRSERFAEGNPDTSEWRMGSDYVRADTGDDFPDDYDAVIAIERIEFLPAGGIRIAYYPDTSARGAAADEPYRVVAGLNVRPAGNSVRAGELLVNAHTRLTPSDLGALAAGGIDEVELFACPRVAFIPTGSELVALGTPPERGQTIDSNSVLVEAMSAEQGAEAVLFPIVCDDRQALAAALEEALATADIVVLNAGSSKGGEDFNAPLLERRGELLCHGIAAAPGRPLAAAMVDGTPVINMPGPPLATYFGMDWLVAELVAFALGLRPDAKPTRTVTLDAPAERPSRMQLLKRFDLRLTEDGVLATPIAMRQSTTPHILTSAAQYVNELHLDSDLAAGDRIEVELLRNPALLSLGQH
jgi:molybdopterin molybdotransferase/putative molybdopterin biosynthesis protein